jgi:hypothetical protein
MPEPQAFYGSNLTASLCGLNNTRVTKKLGPPDALLRYGTFDCGLWSCERVTAFAANRQWMPGASRPVTYYTFPEASRFVGVGITAFKRIIGKTPAPAIQVGTDKTYDLWPEPFLYLIRKAIAEERIYVRPSSLTKPRLGVSVCKPRHTLAADQGAEADAFRRANPYANVQW